MLAGEEPPSVPGPGTEDVSNMRDLMQFAGMLDERIAEVTELRHAEAARLAEAMRSRDAFRDAFDRVAYVTINAILRPRIDAAASRVPGAIVEPVQTPIGRYVGCTVSPSIQRPVTALLCIGIAVDDARQVCAMSAKAEFTPAVPERAPMPILRVALEAPPWDEMVRWTEDALLWFLDSYVSAHQLAAAQEDQLVRDPVCGMMIPMSMAPERWVYRGEAYAFCAHRCLVEFQANPRVYLEGLARMPGA
ncbi:MAG: YHS domain-containing protein [Gemmatimonadaceae bacterium]